jgi:hypothetical protein
MAKKARHQSSCGRAANFLIDAESNLKAAFKGLDSGEKPQ